MLVEIVVENFFSFLDEATFSMVASPIAEHPESVFGKDNLAVTKLATIYGANASGKSNLLKAMKMIQEGILLQNGTAKEWIGKIEPFHLDARKEKEDTLLEVSFLLSGKIYRYGFFVNRERVTEEFLYGEGEEEKDFFIRNQDGEIIGGEWAALFKDIPLEANRLALSSLLYSPLTAAHPVLQSFLKWFTDMRIILDTSKIGLSLFDSEDAFGEIQAQSADVGAGGIPLIQDIVVHEINHPSTGKIESAFVVKMRRNEEGEPEAYCERFRFQDTESAGTVKLLSLAGPDHRRSGKRRAVDGGRDGHAIPYTDDQICPGAFFWPVQ